MYLDCSVVTESVGVMCYTEQNAKEPHLLSRRRQLMSQCDRTLVGYCIDVE